MAETDKGRKVMTIFLMVGAIFRQAISTSYLIVVLRLMNGAEALVVVRPIGRVDVMREPQGLIMISPNKSNLEVKTTTTGLVSSVRRSTSVSDIDDEVGHQVIGESTSVTREKQAQNFTRGQEILDVCFSGYVRMVNPAIVI